MTITCKNCDHHFKGNYCSNCGQPADTHPLNFHFLWHDIQHGLLHLDKGVAFTIKELFTRPGYSIREYIEGKRVKHFKPISLVLVLAGIFGLLFHFFNINILADQVTITVNGTDKNSDQIRETLSVISEWVTGHYAVVSLLQLPFYAFGTFIAFKKMGYNYTEHIIINAFLTSQKLVLRIVSFPFYYFLNGTTAMKNFSAGINIIGVVLMVWTMMQFFNTTKRSSVFWRTVLSLIISVVLFVAAVAAAVILFKPSNLRL